MIFLHKHLSKWEEQTTYSIKTRLYLVYFEGFVCVLAPCQFLMNLTTVTTYLCECREDSVLHACLAHVCLVKGRGRQVRREMEKERDMSHHPQDVSSFWAAVVWELEAALRRPVNSFSHRSPRACKAGAACPLSLATLSRPFPPDFIQINFKPSNVVCSVILTRHTNTADSKWDNFIGKNISRAETDKEKQCIVLFVLQTWLIVHYEMHQLPCTGRINEHIHLWTHSFKMNTFIYSLGKLLTSNFTLSCQTSPMTRELNLSFLRTLLLFIETGHS